MTKTSISLHADFCVIIVTLNSLLYEGFKIKVRLLYKLTSIEIYGLM